MLIGYDLKDRPRFPLGPDLRVTVQGAVPVDGRTCLGYLLPAPGDRGSLLLSPPCEACITENQRVKIRNPGLEMIRCPLQGM